MNPEDQMEHGMGQQAPNGQPMPSEQEIMMAGMIALGLMPPPGQGQQQGQPPMQGQPQPGGGGANARIAQQLMMK